jgi:hypothetical protein
MGIVGQWCVEYDLRVCGRFEGRDHERTASNDTSASNHLLGWIAILGGIVMSIGFVLLGITALRGGPQAPVEQPGSPLYIRGGMIARVRLPTTILPWQQIEIYDDGTVTRGFNPVQSDKHTRIRLTIDEQTAFAHFRTQWCAQVPAFRPLAPDEPFYDVGVRCSAAYTVKQAKVPVETNT